MRPEKMCKFAPKTPYSGGVQRQGQRAYYIP